MHKDTINSVCERRKMNIRKRDAETTGVKPPDKALNQPTRYGETKMTQKFRKSGTIITLAREISSLRLRRRAACHFIKVEIKYTSLVRRYSSTKTPPTHTHSLN